MNYSKSEKEKICKELSKNKNYPKYNIAAYHQALSNFDKIETCLQDNLENLAPICALFNLNTKDCKAILGNQCWKRICKNSKIFNKGLFQYCISRHKLNSQKAKFVKWVCDNNEAGFIEALGFNNVEKYGEFLIERISKLKNKSVSELKLIADTYTDVKRMSRFNGEAFNKNIKWKDLEREHARLTEMTNSAKLNIPANSVFKLPLKCHSAIKKNFKDDEIKAVPLKTVSDFSQEAKEMKHCIMSYCKKSYSGSYVAISLSFRDNRSTLGVRYNKKSGFTIDQHYARLNNPVNCVELKSAAEDIVRMLKEKVIVK